MIVDDEIICENCLWDWKISEGGDKPMVCHKCWYDNEKGVFTDEKMPFDEVVKEGLTYRTFNEAVNNSELVWHRDKEDREVTTVGHTDWKIQFDNELPISLNETVKIPKNTYHRLIKGSGDLKVKIKKK